MVNLRELRIGNKIADANGKIITVCGILFPFKIINDEETQSSHNSDDCYPIDLTDGWFKLMNFKLRGDTQEWHAKDIGAFIIDNGHSYSLVYATFTIGCFPRPEIKYVHHIQNIYFDLTNKEVTFKTIIR
jgi:hypothetical protein